MEKEEFIRKTLHFAHEQHMWQKGDHILIAESGGPDSLALLLFLKSVAREEQLTLGACCVNHHLRPEAEAETEFVAKVCAEQGIACYIRQAYVTEVSEQTGESMETAGRRLRYEAFEEICRNEGYNLVATAHHANDQAETVLYHLIRGAGLMGLTGIHPRRGTRIRPFLWATKKQIGEFVSHFPYEPCHDITNDMAITARNHIRLELLPELAGYNPSIVQALSRTAEILREDEEAMEQMAEKMAEGCVTSNAAGMPAILVPQFRNCHLAFRRRIVRLVMQKVLDRHDQGGRTIGYDGIEKVRKLIENGHTGQSTSSAGVLVTLERNQARFSSGDTHYQKDDAPDTYILEQQILHKRPENLRKNQFLLDKDKVGTVVLRHGTRDELFYPRGMQGSKKLFKCMQDLKIPAVKRKYWPLAADAEHIYWIGGMRGSRFGLPDEHTETFLLLTLRRKSR